MIDKLCDQPSTYVPASFVCFWTQFLCFVVYFGQDSDHGFSLVFSRCLDYVAWNIRMTGNSLDRIQKAAAMDLLKSYPGHSEENLERLQF
jgi:hypothetical protein